MKTIVLDVNCLLQILPHKAPKRWLYDLILKGKLSLAFSSEIVLEYQEIITRKTSEHIAHNVISALIELPDSKKVEPAYRWQLIKGDEDDNKYTDCTIACGADYIISNDKHFDQLHEVEFPKVICLKLLQVKKSLFD